MPSHGWRCLVSPLRVAQIQQTLSGRLRGAGRYQFRQLGPALMAGGVGHSAQSPGGQSNLALAPGPTIRARTRCASPASLEPISTYSGNTLTSNRGQALDLSGLGS